MQHGNLNDLLAFGRLRWSVVSRGRRRSLAYRIRAQRHHPRSGSAARLAVLTRTTRSVAPTEAGERLLHTVARGSKNRGRARGAERASRETLRHHPHYRDRLCGRHDPLAEAHEIPAALSDVNLEMIIEYGLTDIVADGLTPGYAAASRWRRT